MRVDEGLYRALDTGHFPWLVQHHGWKVLRIYGQPLRCSFVFNAGGQRADPLDGTEVSRGAASFKIGTTAIAVRM